MYRVIPLLDTLRHREYLATHILLVVYPIGNTGDCCKRGCGCNYRVPILTDTAVAYPEQLLARRMNFYDLYFSGCSWTLWPQRSLP